MSTIYRPTQIPDGRHEIKGNTYMADTRGGFVPIETIKAQDLLQDETVRKIIGHAMALSDQIARFKAHTFEDIGDFEAILAQEYSATIGGKKGNKTLMSVDGLFKVTVAAADRISFGPELQIAKSLFDECLNDWSADAAPELRSLVNDAFNTDKEGTINRALIFTIQRQETSDPRWKRGQEAIKDAIKVVGSKTYVRCYRRDSYDADWRAITIDLAKA